jgi:hypothetical protein
MIAYCELMRNKVMLSSDKGCGFAGATRNARLGGGPPRASIRIESESVLFAVMRAVKGLRGFE